MQAKKTYREPWFNGNGILRVMAICTRTIVENEYWADVLVDLLQVL